MDDPCPIVDFSILVLRTPSVKEGTFLLIRSRKPLPGHLLDERVKEMIVVKYA
jgi:hypothetical protein